MHIQGTPKTMQLNPEYKNVTDSVCEFFGQKLNEAAEAGIKEIIIDPGFGFGKTVEENFKIIRKLDTLKQLGLPILLGASRKSSLYKTLGIEPKDALNATTVANTVALLYGANILRVHDVKEANEIIQLLPYLK
jgi:dihydropteroate synthase